MMRATRPHWLWLVTATILFTFVYTRVQRNTWPEASPPETMSKARPAPVTRIKSEVRMPIYYVLGTKPVTELVPVPVVTSGGVVEVQVGEINDEFPLILAQALFRALKAHPTARYFRLTWECLVLYPSLQESFKSTLLYDRSVQSAKFFTKGERLEGAGMKKYGNNMVFSSVTEKVIQRWADLFNRSYTPRSAIRQSDDDFLAHYGAQVVTFEVCKQKS